MFTTDLKDFHYKPLIEDDHIVKNRVVLQGWVIWKVETGVEIAVPPGFTFDLASVPWWLGFIAQKLGRHQRAAALHDWLYFHNIGSREWCDAQFKAAMKHDKVNALQRWVIWKGTRRGGFLSWLKHASRITRESRDE